MFSSYSEICHTKNRKEVLTVEKDYFQDRPKESCIHSFIKEGMFVYICEKKAQKYAKQLEDLTLVRVNRVLTKHDHPRGIKVSGIVFEQRENSSFCETKRIAVGRVVYICSNIA